MNLKVFEFLGKEVQSSTTDIREALDLLLTSIDSAIEQVDEKSIPNYSDYLADSEVEYNLYEDLTHKRPCAIKIEGNRIQKKD